MRKMDFILVFSFLLIIIPIFILAVDDFFVGKELNNVVRLIEEFSYVDRIIFHGSSSYDSWEIDQNTYFFENAKILLNPFVEPTGGALARRNKNSLRNECITKNNTISYYIENVHLFLVEFCVLKTPVETEISNNLFRLGDYYVIAFIGNTKYLAHFGFYDWKEVEDVINRLG